mmetsp:Transcript_38583/g.34139  ORF Transcript_38583/g.34139 Transcript_38583/m.34139 type:complete len:179 (-) Transcript_38583:57-593(-)
MASSSSSSPHSSHSQSVSSPMKHIKQQYQHQQQNNNPSNNQRSQPQTQTQTQRQPQPKPKQHPSLSLQQQQNSNDNHGDLVKANSLGHASKPNSTREVSPENKTASFGGRGQSHSVPFPDSSFMDIHNAHNNASPHNNNIGNVYQERQLKVQIQPPSPNAAESARKKTKKFLWWNKNK